LEEELARAEAVLDLGCGVGGFGAHLARRFGRKTHGIDLVQHPGFIADAYASFQRLDLDAIEAGSVGRRFDLIFALGVIEYLTDPRALVCAVPHWLGPRGRFVITTPNPASLRSILSLAVRGEFSAFRAVSNPAAITPVLAADASRMFLEAGFDRVEMDYSGRGRPPFLRRGAYQRVVPWLTGRLFSDDYRVIGSINTSAAR
jgi:2-polyprenyl-3-methyl-5-hydroxy-6-metoxy-1,4-benzoquinol methylase